MSRTAASKPTTGTPESIGDAIRERRLLALTYAGHRRVVEPHIHGLDAKGHVALSCYQVRGGSRSGVAAGWKHLRLDDVRGLTILDETFARPRPDYNPRDPAFRVVYSQL